MMVAAYGFALALMLVMRLAPSSAAGRLLNHTLVVIPLRTLGKMQRHHLIFVLVLASLAMVGTEVLFALGSVDIAVVYALDLSLYIDGLLATLALASLSRTRSGFMALRAGSAVLAARMRRARGRRRVHGVRKPSARKASNDDEHPAALPLTA